MTSEHIDGAKKALQDGLLAIQMAIKEYGSSYTRDFIQEQRLDSARRFTQGALYVLSTLDLLAMGMDALKDLDEDAILGAILAKKMVAPSPPAATPSHTGLKRGAGGRSGARERRERVLDYLKQTGAYVETNLIVGRVGAPYSAVYNDLNQLRNQGAITWETPNLWKAV